MNNIDDLIDYIEESIPRFACSDCHAKSVLQDVLDSANELKANMEADDGWISVEIETPPQRKDILIYHSGRYVVSGFRDGDGYYTYAVINYDNERVEIDPIGPGRVSHWKTLPNPPKDKQS